MHTSDYAEWKEAAEKRGYTVENDGGNKMIAHVDGDEKGWYDPAYGGFGMGELE